MSARSSPRRSCRLSLSSSAGRCRSSSWAASGSPGCCSGCPSTTIPSRVRRVSPAELAYLAADSAADGPAGSEPLPWHAILRYRQAWSFIVAKFVTDPVWWFFLIWLPAYFKSARGLDIKTSWIHLVSIYSIITVLSVAGGWLTGRLVRGLGIGRGRKTAMLIFALCVVPILLVTKTSDWGSVVLIGIAGAAHQAWSANLFTTVSDMFPKRAVASVVGIGGMAGSVGGIIFPIYAGKLLDRFQAAGNITTGYAILFTICGSAYLVAFVVNQLLAPRFEPIESTRTVTRSWRRRTNSRRFPALERRPGSRPLRRERTVDCVGHRAMLVVVQARAGHFLTTLEEGELIVASVYAKRGTWYLSYRDPSGRWLTKASKAKTKTEARRLADDLERRNERQAKGLEPLRAQTGQFMSRRAAPRSRRCPPTL